MTTVTVQPLTPSPMTGAHVTIAVKPTLETCSHLLVKNNSLLTLSIDK